MESVGARLKKIRLEKGLALEEVHKKTKIHLSILKAIEEDSTMSLNPIYIKGFLKIYSNFLGQDPKDYTSGYPESKTTLKVITDKFQEPASFLKNISLRLSFFRLPKIKIKTIFMIVFGLCLLTGLFSLGKFISSKRHSQLRKEEIKIPRQAALPKKEVLGAIRLTIRAREDCWINLKVDGRVVFRSVLKKGKFESWQAKEKIEFSLANAGAVELELNSKPIPTLGRKGQSLKNIVITKEEGLVVPR